MAIAPPDELRQSGSARLDYHDNYHNNRTASYYLFFVSNKRSRHQQQPQTQQPPHTAAAAAKVATAAADVQRGWRWRWRLGRQRCAIATVVDKISTEYDMMQ